MMKNTRPLGVAFIGVIEMLWGSVLIFYALVLIRAAIWDPASGSGLNFLGLLFGPIVGIIGFFIVRMGLNTFKLKSFGRISNLYFFSLAIIGAILFRPLVFFTFPYIVVPVEIIFERVLKLPSYWSQIVEAVILLLPIIYLTQAKVKAHFYK